ncbi:hypothetical protein J6590_007847 [Homalodisca vitripennis]|nr:hypothetical protein J6590_007846 [Homalodisca vitripennis]KAG8283838.1 hypothetical protein J6590_007847 [Homalodisca vitripennis]
MLFKFQPEHLMETKTPPINIDMRYTTILLPLNPINPWSGIVGACYAESGIMYVLCLSICRSLHCNVVDYG